MLKNIIIKQFWPSNKQKKVWSFFKDSSIQKSDLEDSFKIIDFSKLETLDELPYKITSFYDLKDLADSGNKIAQCNVGICYEKGIGIIQSPQKAFSYYKLSAKNGHEEAFYNLGECFFNGFGCVKSYKKAIHFFELSLENRTFGSLSYLADIYNRKKGTKNKKLAKFYQKKIFNYLNTLDSSDPDILYMIGDCYQEGIGIRKSLKKAFYYYILVIMQNGPHACIDVGDFYKNGWGVRKSLKKALIFYEREYIQSKSVMSYISIINLLTENKIDEKKLFFYLTEVIEKKVAVGDDLIEIYKRNLNKYYQNDI